MRNKKLLWLFILTTMLTVSGCTGNSSKNNNANPQNNNLNANDNQLDKTSNSFTLAEINLHNSPTDCYTTINGLVYDLTSFIKQHPGGAEKIESICGLDGTSAFNGQHGGKDLPAQILESLKIGSLQQ